MGPTLLVSDGDEGNDDTSQSAETMHELSTVDSIRFMGEITRAWLAANWLYASYMSWAHGDTSMIESLLMFTTCALQAANASSFRSPSTYTKWPAHCNEEMRVSSKTTTTTHEYNLEHTLASKLLGGCKNSSCRCTHSTFHIGHNTDTWRLPDFGALYGITKALIVVRVAQSCLMVSLLSVSRVQLNM